MKSKVRTQPSMQTNGREKRGVTIQIQLGRSFESDPQAPVPEPIHRKPVSAQPAHVSQKPTRPSLISRPLVPKPVSKPSAPPRPPSIAVISTETLSGEETKPNNGAERALLIHQNKMLEKLVTELQAKLRATEVRKPLKQPPKEASRGHPFFQALKSLAQSCQRYLQAEGPYVQTVHDVEMGFSYQSLLTSLDLAQCCLGEQKGVSVPVTGWTSPHSSFCESRADQGDSYSLRKRLLQYQSEKQNLVVRAERPVVPPLFEKVAASFKTTFSQIENTLANTQEKLTNLHSKLTSVRSTPRDTCDSESRDMCTSLVNEVKKQQEDLRTAHTTYARQLEDLREEHSRSIAKVREEGEAEAKTLMAEAIQAVNVVKEKEARITALETENEKLKEESEEKAKENRSLAIMTQELEGKVKEAKEQEKVLQWESRTLAKKLSAQSRSFELERLALKAEQERTTEALLQQTEQSLMTLCDVESLALRDSELIVSGKRSSGKVAISPSEQFVETTVLCFDEVDPGLLQMVLEDFRSHIVRVEARVRELEVDCSALHCEKSLLQLDNSQLAHDCDAAASAPCNCMLTRMFPADLVQELDHALTAIRAKWVQEMELEKHLRLEISVLKEENWMLKTQLREALQRSFLNSSSPESESRVCSPKADLTPRSWMVIDPKQVTDSAFDARSDDRSRQRPSALQEIGDFEQRMQRTSSQAVYLRPASSEVPAYVSEAQLNPRAESPGGMSEYDSSALGRTMSEASLLGVEPENAVAMKIEINSPRSSSSPSPKESPRNAAEIENLVRRQFPGEKDLLVLLRLLSAEASASGHASPPKTPKWRESGETVSPQVGEDFASPEPGAKQNAHEELPQTRVSVESSGAPAYYHSQLRRAVLRLVAATPKQ